MPDPTSADLLAEADESIDVFDKLVADNERLRAELDALRARLVQTEAALQQIVDYGVDKWSGDKARDALRAIPEAPPVAVGSGEPWTRGRDQATMRSYDPPPAAEVSTPP